MDMLRDPYLQSQPCRGFASAGICRSGPLHGQVRQSDHRHLLVVPVSDFSWRPEDLAVEPSRYEQSGAPRLPLRFAAGHRHGLLGTGTPCRRQHEALVLRQSRRDEARSRLRHRVQVDGGSLGRGRRDTVQFAVACPLVCLSADLLDGDRCRFPVPRAGLGRHSLHHRDRSALAGQRTYRDHQSRSGSIRQSARACSLCG